MSGHTPGPWVAYESSERCPWPAGVYVEVGTLAGKGNKAGTICEMVGQGKGKYVNQTTNLNALLIAAAPDLLQAAHLVAKADADQTHAKPDLWASALYACRAAIAKAEGR